MSIVWYVVFLFVTHRLLLFLFTFSTYHRTARWAVPAVVGYGVLVGLLLFQLGLWSFFIWHVGVSTLLLVKTSLTESRAGNEIITRMRIDERAAAELSIASTRAYYWLSSVLYVLAFTISFLAFLNLSLPR